jgi:asparagine synthase (glutamine-hydrolysing)
MPGIIGIISREPAHQCEAKIAVMAASIYSEPFYKTGAYSVPDLGIYAAWVAHESSVAANQVFLNENREIALVWAGECFFSPETRSELVRRGHEVGPEATSWLVHLYEEQGEQFFEKLNGLFSGLLIDRRSRKAFLFNDRYGVERIYWHESEDCFYFGSEAKALLRVLPQLREFDLEGVSQFLNFGCTLHSRTLFRGIQLLPEASVWCFEGMKCHKRKYFLPETWEAQSVLSMEEFGEEFGATLERVLPRFFVADSKPGISLTGGLDSRLIMAFLPQTDPKPVSYTFSGAEQDVLDARVAARVAQACHIEHHIIRLSNDFFSNFQQLADKTVYVTDGTLGILGAHEIYLNRKARMLSPVRITGVFGGEIMRGVSFFNRSGLASRLLCEDLRGSLCPIELEKEQRKGNPVSFAAFSEIPQRRFGTPAAARSQLTFRTPYLDNDFVALAYRTPPDIQNNPHFADRGRLGNSGYLSQIIRRTAAEVTFKLDYYYSEGLPRSTSALCPLFRRFATGTGIAGSHKFLTYRNWFAAELAKYVQDGLAEARDQQTGLWNSKVLRTLVREHRLGGHYTALAINAVLTLSAVQRLLLKTGSASSNDTNPGAVAAGNAHLLPTRPDKSPSFS